MFWGGSEEDLRRIWDSLYRDPLYRDALYRDSVYRDSLYTDSLYRDSLYRDSLCRDALSAHRQRACAHRQRALASPILTAFVVPFARNRAHHGQQGYNVSLPHAFSRTRNPLKLC